MNIKDKLQRLDKSYSSIKRDESAKVFSDEQFRDFEYELSAKVLHEKNSVIILKENFYPLYNHSFVTRTRENGYLLPEFHRISLEPTSKGLDLRRSIFIDLETTGLSGGTGTFAFLIGLGHIELDQIIVRQYLLPDFQYEWLMLKHIENVLINFDNIISFNGKSFDIPLLRNRFILNRMDSMLDELVHTDILHPARRLWKRRLSSCDLENLEYTILNQERINDIPGEMIPQIYFEFIRKRQAILLRDILEHNYYDIVNMILLTIFIGQAIENPLDQLKEEDDLYSLAKFYYHNNHYIQAIPILENLCSYANNIVLQNDANFLLSMSYKKLGSHKQSSELFQRLLRNRSDHADAIEELAKYYEHKEKNYQAALELVNRSLEHIDLHEQLGKQSPLLQKKDSLLHRKNRLQRKLVQYKNGRTN